jgi:hypothetical protein
MQHAQGGLHNFILGSTNLERLNERHKQAGRHENNEMCSSINNFCRQTTLELAKPDNLGVKVKSR